MWPLRVPNLAGAACLNSAPRSTYHLSCAPHPILCPPGFHNAPYRCSLKRGLRLEARKKREQSPYQATVTLPQTEFSLRANSVTREPEIQKFWEDNKVYQSLSESNSGEKFTLHDGPPYANGDLHIGHALNKILKDFINR